MTLNRRKFIKMLAAGSAAGLVTGPPAKALSGPAPDHDFGCLVDTTLCVGCRSCEAACNERNALAQPRESFRETAVLENERRMDETTFTVINKYYPRNMGTLVWRKEPTFVKFQCMHCQDPSCVSACIVGALKKEPSGPVTYDASKCIGCRYCMIACPFQVPAYEYHDPLTPRVRKCTFCFDQVKDGGLPACAQVCPREAIVFGRRDKLLKLARWRIRTNPSKYVNHIYGEREVGGTSWLYLASEPFESIGFPKLDGTAPPRLTESIQHVVVGGLILPLGLYAGLGGIMWLTGFLKRNGHDQDRTGEVSHD